MPLSNLEITHILIKFRGYLNTTNANWCGCYEGDMDGRFPQAVNEAVAKLREILIAEKLGEPTK